MDITQDVATMIFGQNLDNDNQKCNGSGKSSLIEAIAFGITGDTLRKVKVEDIINDKADDASVQLLFTNDYNGLMFTIDRSVGRKSPQRVECHLVKDGNEVHTDRTVQPSVTEYNKYILSELGVTKDELYSSFILCKNHYQSFLDASDRNKKEIINRFSNGVIVDESIEKLAADIVPVQQQVTDAELRVSKIRGKIEAIGDELNNADAKKEEAARSREAKVEEYNSKIAQKRAEIRSYGELVEKAMARRNDIRKFDGRMQELENGDNTLEQAYEVISRELAALSLPPIKDYVSNGRKYSEEIEGIRARVKSCMNELADCEKETESLNKRMVELTGEVESFRKKCDLANTADRQHIDEIEGVIEKLKVEQRGFHFKNREETVNLNALNVRLDKIEAMLRGSIRCPLCGGEFVLNAEKGIDEMRAEKADIEKLMEVTRKAIAESAKNEESIANQIVDNQDKCLCINGNINDRNREYQKISNSLTTISVMCDKAKTRYSSIQSEVQQSNSQISALNGKIQNLSTLMYDEVFGIIDSRMSQAKDYIDDLKSKVKFAEGQIEQYQSAIEEVRNQKTEDIAIRLEASKRQYEKDLGLAEADYNGIKARYDELVVQQELFIEFKSHLANQKIDAIAAVTNEFLELIGSDIRLQLEGYRRLKSGKLRDKITVKILRNGMDCGAFEKFSGGERARVYLANILAMQKITNSNCDEGKGLDLLIEDEILDCSDESGMMSFCEALNELGATSMLVTQVPVSESYPYKLLVTKQNGESKISM